MSDVSRYGKKKKKKVKEVSWQLISYLYEVMNLDKNRMQEDLLPRDSFAGVEDRKDAIKKATSET